MVDDRRLTVSNLHSKKAPICWQTAGDHSKWGKQQGIDKQQKLPHRETDILCLNPALWSDKERSLPLDHHLGFPGVFNSFI